MLESMLKEVASQEHQRLLRGYQHYYEYVLQRLLRLRRLQTSWSRSRWPKYYQMYLVRVMTSMRYW